MNLFTPIVVSGTDARIYLQGQLTCDVDQLSRDNSLLGCCNSAQGRVQAVLTLLERSDGILLLVVPEMAERTLARLRKYVLRSKVTIEDANRNLHVAGLTADQLPQTRVRPFGSLGMHQEIAGESCLRWPDTQSERYLLVGSDPQTTGFAPQDLNWLLADIRAGLPQVYPETHEAFVAQMLNLDLLGGISFDKGCYTGQEIIARTHYRGAIKRRMLRYQAACPPPRPGTRLTANGEHAGEVVMSAATELGCELLAVISLAQADSVIQLEEQPMAPMQRLPLPYSP